jgi:hypothetical protein
MLTIGCGEEGDGPEAEIGTIITDFRPTGFDKSRILIDENSPFVIKTYKSTTYSF